MITRVPVEFFHSPSILHGNLCCFVTSEGRHQQDYSRSNFVTVENVQGVQLHQYLPLYVQDTC